MKLRTFFKAFSIVLLLSGFSAQAMMHGGRSNIEVVKQKNSDLVQTLQTVGEHVAQGRLQRAQQASQSLVRHLQNVDDAFKGSLHDIMVQISLNSNPKSIVVKIEELVNEINSTQARPTLVILDVNSAQMHESVAPVQAPVIPPAPSMPKNGAKAKHGPAPEQARNGKMIAESSTSNVGLPAQVLAAEQAPDQATLAGQSVVTVISDNASSTAAPAAVASSSPGIWTWKQLAGALVVSAATGYGLKKASESDLTPVTNALAQAVARIPSKEALKGALEISKERLQKEGCDMVARGILAYDFTVGTGLVRSAVTKAVSYGPKRQTLENTRDAVAQYMTREAATAGLANAQAVVVNLAQAAKKAVQAHPTAAKVTGAVALGTVAGAVVENRTGAISGMWNRLKNKAHDFTGGLL